jgi:hypothetical protein
MLLILARNVPRRPCRASAPHHVKQPEPCNSGCPVFWNRLKTWTVSAAGSPSHDFTIRGSEAEARQPSPPVNGPLVLTPRAPSFELTICCVSYGGDRFRRLMADDSRFTVRIAPLFPASEAASRPCDATHNPAGQPCPLPRTLLRSFHQPGLSALSLTCGIWEHRPASRPGFRGRVHVLP